MSDRTKGAGSKGANLGKSVVMESGKALHNNFKVGIIMLDHFSEMANIMLEGCKLTLQEFGVSEQNITLKYIPEPFNITIATQFMAEYTEVDTVIILGCVDKRDLSEPMEQSLLGSLTQIQMQWNMPCIWNITELKDGKLPDLRTLFDSGARGAMQALHMVTLQAEMLAAAPGELVPHQNVN